MLKDVHRLSLVSKWKLRRRDSAITDGSCDICVSALQCGLDSTPIQMNIPQPPHSYNSETTSATDNIRQSSSLNQIQGFKTFISSPSWGWGVYPAIIALIIRSVIPFGTKKKKHNVHLCIHVSFSVICLILFSFDLSILCNSFVILWPKEIYHPLYNISSSHPFSITG